MGDRELIDALRRGDRAAWDEWVGLYLKFVYHVVRRVLSAYGRASEEDVEDVTHDLFQGLVKDQYRVLGAIGEPYDLKAWLAVSARRRAIDFVRRRRPVPVSLDDLARTETTPAPPAEDADASVQAEYRHAVNDSLAALNPKERLVVQLFYLSGKKYREIARITGINVNSISPTLMRAVEKMQKFLKDKNLLGAGP